MCIYLPCRFCSTSDELVYKKRLQPFFIKCTWLERCFKSRITDPHKLASKLRGFLLPRRLTRSAIYGSHIEIVSKLVSRYSILSWHRPSLLVAIITNWLCHVLCPSVLLYVSLSGCLVFLSVWLFFLQAHAYQNAPYSIYYILCLLLLRMLFFAWCDCCYFVMKVWEQMCTWTELKLSRKLQKIPSFDDDNITPGFFFSVLQRIKFKNPSDHLEIIQLQRSASGYIIGPTY